MRSNEIKKEIISIPEIVRGMTELLQRSVGPSFNMILHSQKGRGTTAELWLPVAEPSSKPAVAAQAVPARSFRPLTVLAVEDDALVMLNIVGMLEDLGHTVIEAYSGKEALEILRREDSVDLVITGTRQSN